MKFSAKILDKSKDSNIGLYCHVNNQFAIVPNTYNEEIIKDISEVLKVKVIKTNIMGTELCGVMLSYDSYDDILYVPSMILKHEEQVLIDNDIKYVKINSKFNALCNNVVFFKDIAILNKEISGKELNEYEKVIDKDILRLNVEFDSVGQLFVPFGSKTLMSYALEEHIDEIMDYINLEIIPTSINNSNPYLSSGILINKNGFIIHEFTTSIEISNIEELYEE